MGFPIRVRFSSTVSPFICWVCLKPYASKLGKARAILLKSLFGKMKSEEPSQVPAQIENLMKKEGLLPVFKKLSYTHRKEYCPRITEAKKEETRLKRLEKAIEMLKQAVSTPG